MLQNIVQMEGLGGGVGGTIPVGGICIYIYILIYTLGYKLPYMSMWKTYGAPQGTLSTNGCYSTSMLAYPRVRGTEATIYQSTRLYLYPFTSQDSTDYDYRFIPI